MRWFRNLTALVLLVLWLPATQHCDLEAAGILSDAGCCSAEEGCAQDDCVMVESGHYKSGVGMLKLPPPIWTILTGYVPPAASLLAMMEDSSFRAGAVPLAGEGWLLPWRFARRAAPLPGAPSLG